MCAIAPFLAEEREVVSELRSFILIQFFESSEWNPGEFSLLVELGSCSWNAVTSTYKKVCVVDPVGRGELVEHVR